MINGINYFEGETKIEEYGEVIADCVAVKGDYFYLKKGEQVKINYEIKGYFEVKHK